MYVCLFLISLSLPPPPPPLSFDRSRCLPTSFCLSPSLSHLTCYLSLSVRIVCFWKSARSIHTLDQKWRTAYWLGGHFDPITIAQTFQQQAFILWIGCSRPILYKKRLRLYKVNFVYEKSSSSLATIDHGWSWDKDPFQTLTQRRVWLKDKFGSGRVCRRCHTCILCRCWMLVGVLSYGRAFPKLQQWVFPRWIWVVLSRWLSTLGGLQQGFPSLWS